MPTGVRQLQCVVIIRELGVAASSFYNMIVWVTPEHEVMTCLPQNVDSKVWYHFGFVRFSMDENFRHSIFLWIPRSCVLGILRA